MAEVMSFESERKALIEIQRIAASIQMNTRIYSSDLVSSPSPSKTQVVIPSIIFPFPEEIFDPLLNLEIPQDLRQTLIDYLKRRIAELQERYTAAYEEAYLASMRVSNLHDLGSIQRVYQIRFQQRCLPMIEAQISSIINRVEKSDTKYTSESNAPKRPFNNSYTPLLEKYFEYNGYPSVAHRSHLAQKSMMAPRQIEVWFQNHRNRAKKERKAIPRLTSDFPLKQALSVFQQITPANPSRLPTPPAEESAGNIHTSLETSSPHPVHTVNSPKSGLIARPTFLDDAFTTRPLHAFPSTRHSHYPDPFPSDGGIFTFPSPIWIRKAATSPIVSNAIDMDEFASLFHLKLNFSERRGGSTLKHESHSCQPWFSATTTFVSPAPHPALVRTPPFSLSILSHTPTCMETLKSHPTFGSSSLSAPVVPSSSSTFESPARKTRPLPRRFPNSRTKTFASRIPSFSSDTSSRSRTSSSDYSSPEPSTPPSLPYVDLAAVQGDAQQPDLLDFSRESLGNAYSMSEILPQDPRLSDAFPILDKFAGVPFIDNLFPDFCHNLGDIIS